jgi:hypothetical protein
MSAKLKLTDGATYGYDGNGQRICTGSQMGRRNVLPENKQVKDKIHLTRLKWVDGDYDEGGAYWGNGDGRSRIYCAWGDLGNEAFSTQIFVRAKSRSEAKHLVLEILPNIQFYR